MDAGPLPLPGFSVLPLAFSARSSLFPMALKLSPTLPSAEPPRARSLLVHPGLGAPRAPHTDACPSAKQSPPSPPHTLPVSVRGGAAAALSQFRGVRPAPQLLKLRPRRGPERAALALRGREGVRAETRPPQGGRPAGRRGRRGRKPSRPSAPEPRGSRSRAAWGEEFSQNGTAGKARETPIPGAVSQRPRGREGAGETGREGESGAGWGRRGSGEERLRSRGVPESRAGNGERSARRGRTAGRGGPGAHLGRPAAVAGAGAAAPPTASWSLKGGSLECAE